MPTRQRGELRTQPEAGEGAALRLQPGREFSPAFLRLRKTPPHPLPRMLVWLCAALLGTLLLWSMIGSLDIVAVAQGKLVPREYLKVVQTADTGVLRDLAVREGQTVERGQVLFRLDPQLSQADGRSLANELAQRELQIARIDAELAGIPLTGRGGDWPQEYLAQARQQWLANRNAYQAALAAEQSALERARSELRSALEVLAKLEQTAPLLQAALERSQALVAEGFVAKEFVDERARQAIERQQDLVAQQHSVASLRAAVTQSEQRVAQVQSAYRQSLTSERAQAELALGKVREDLVKQRVREGLIEISAPQRGVVKDLATHTPGTFVQAGATLLSIVPLDDVLEAEVLVSNADAAYVLPGQSVQVKIESYPYTRYGMLPARVLRISPDASEVRTEQGTQNSVDGKFELHSTYRARLALQSQTLTARGREMPLLAGMTAVAEIHIGQRSVLEYVLSPVRATLHEAGRER